MLRIYTGEDRVAIQKAVERELEGKYEVFEGENLTLGDLPSIFQGLSLFGGGDDSQRQILLKDVSENTAVWEKIVEYANSSHNVIIWEGKIDKRSAVYKKLKEAGVELKEFSLKKKPEFGVVFGIYDTALRDGAAAVRMVEKIELEQDPYMFFGLMVTQALKRFETHPTGKEKRIIKELGKLDMQMKGDAGEVEPWMLIKAFLVRLKGM